ncbi:growth arrest and DNA damage-inducible protein GADD45 gamma-like [Oscarella lobularis]|uniref:growth arrest and DNA damage-inducible protein GADD45 gamma-like n=1 Tax=Oscarella lobularis TaxID=121494 RepID=UPI0033132F58
MHTQEQFSIITDTSSKGAMLTYTRHHNRGRKSLCRYENLDFARVTSVLSDCLFSVVQTAKKEGQLVSGVRAVATALEKCGDEDPALCVLATEDRDITDPAVQIYFTLIEAYCREYGVQLLKVDSSALLGKWAVSNSSETCGCVLIQNTSALKGLMVLVNHCRRSGEKKIVSLVDPIGDDDGIPYN